MLRDLMLLIAIWALFLFAVTAKLTHAETITEPRLEQKTGVVLTKTIGSIIFRITKQRPLPNAFGGRDIFGGKIDEGFFEIRYLGASAGQPKFRITDVHKSSTEGTLTRYRRSLVNIQMGAADSSGDVLDFKYDMRDGDTLEFEDHTLTILKVTNSQIKYQID